MEEKQDVELVKLARAANKQAFLELIERYQVMAMNLAQRFCREQETAHELVQEAILQAFLSLDQLQHEERFRNWFYGIVLNVCRNWLRTSRQQQTLSLETQANEQTSRPLFSDTPSHPFLDPQEIIEERELQALLRQALNMLSLNNRQVVHLFYYEDMSIADISQSLNISPMAVKSRLHKGREQLRGHLRLLLPDLTSSVTDKGKERRMIAVKVARVLQKRDGNTTVILLDERRQRVLPLQFPKPIRTALFQPMHTSAREDAVKEPSTTDFMGELLLSLGGELQKVAIDALHGYILYAQLHLRIGRRQQVINAHLHDTLPLALQLHCPFVVSSEVFKQKGIDLKKKGAALEHQLDTMIGQAGFASKPASPNASEDLEFAQGLAGWTIAGDRKYFDYHLDADTTSTGKPSLAINLYGTEHQGYLQLKHADIAAEPYRGQRVRLVAHLKAEHVRVAGLNLGVDASPLDPEQKFPDFYTTESPEPIRGTHDWTRHELVIDVPVRAYTIRPIFSMWRKGKVWLDGLRLEVVEKSVPLTGTRLPVHTSPLNLDFRQGLSFWEFSQQRSLWAIEGNPRQEYQCGLEQTAEGTATAFLKAIVEQPQERVTFEQGILANQHYAGKRLRLSASMKTAAVVSQASLFLNVSPAGSLGGSLPAEEMIERVVSGTTDWTHYEIEADVPRKWGQLLSIGITLHGQGQIWVKNIQVETVDKQAIRR